MFTLFAAYFARQIEEIPGDQYLLPDNFPLIKGLQIEKNLFDESTILNPHVNIYWGVKGINRENKDKWDPEDLGEIILDDLFELGSLET